MDFNFHLVLVLALLASVATIIGGLLDIGSPYVLIYSYGGYVVAVLIFVCLMEVRKWRLRKIEKTWYKTEPKPVQRPPPQKVCS